MKRDDEIGHLDRFFLALLLGAENLFLKFGLKLAEMGAENFLLIFHAAGAGHARPNGANFFQVAHGALAVEGGGLDFVPGAIGGEGGALFFLAVGGFILV